MKKEITKVALSLAFSCLSRGFSAAICVLLIIKVLKKEGWVLKYTFSIFVGQLYCFCLSIVYILQSAPFLHRESTYFLIVYI